MARRALQAKWGICHRYTNPKRKYIKRCVAEYDRGVLQAKLPDETVNVFRCRHCGAWHVGKED